MIEYKKKWKETSNKPILTYEERVRLYKKLKKIDKYMEQTLLDLYKINKALRMRSGTTFDVERVNLIIAPLQSLRSAFKYHIYGITELRDIFFSLEEQERLNRE